MAIGKTRKHVNGYRRSFVPKKYYTIESLKCFGFFYICAASISNSLQSSFG